MDGLWRRSANAAKRAQLSLRGWRAERNADAAGGISGCSQKPVPRCRIARSSKEVLWNLRCEIRIPRVLAGLVYPKAYPENRSRGRKRPIARAVQDFSIQPQLDRGICFQLAGQADRRCADSPRCRREQHERTEGHRVMQPPRVSLRIESHCGFVPVIACSLHSAPRPGRKTGSYVFMLVHNHARVLAVMPPNELGPIKAVRARAATPSVRRAEHLGSKRGFGVR